MSTNGKTNPYMSVGDLLSRVQDFKIIESTLREGEQFANAYFDTETKIKMFAIMLLLPFSGRLLTQLP
jgi:homocitrate synthase